MLGLRCGICKLLMAICLVGMLTDHVAVLGHQDLRIPVVTSGPLPGCAPAVHSRALDPPCFQPALPRPSLPSCLQYATHPMC